MGSLALLNQINPNSQQAPAEIVPLGTSGFALSLCVNFLVTTLIVGRIWYISRQSRRVLPDEDNALQNAMSIMIESGTPVLIAQFIFVVLFAISHPAQAVLVPAATQIYVRIASSLHCRQAYVNYRAFHRL